MPHDDEDVEQLLARGYLGGATYDRIESSVMRRVSPQTSKKRPAWLWAAVVPAAAGLGALALLLGVPGAASEQTGFRAKGSGAALTGAVELACSAHSRCRTGDTLVFVVDTGVVHGYLNASARRVRPESPERIHFFPTKEGDSPRLEARTGTRVVPQGVRLTNALGAGVYQVDVWFTDSAPSLQPNEERRTSIELVVED